MTGERVLITGVNGFIGRHMATYLLARQMTVLGIGRSRTAPIRHPQFFYKPCDLRDEAQVLEWMAQNDVHYIIHLAAETDVHRLADNPLRVLNTNCMGTMRLLEAVRLKPQMRVKGILIAGSAHEYATGGGKSGDEDTPTSPSSLYGWSKSMSTGMGKMYAQLFGLPVVIARTFNVIGPGAAAGVCPSLARQVAEMERGIRPPRLVVGNMDIERDFIDVRDVVAAYWALLKEAPFQPGEVYNVASGTSRRIGEMVEIFRRHALCPFEVTVDETLFRPGELLKVRGENEKLRKATGWRPQWPFEQSVMDVLTHARRSLRPSPTTNRCEKGGDWT